MLFSIDTRSSDLTDHLPLLLHTLEASVSLAAPCDTVICSTGPFRVPPHPSVTRYLHCAAKPITIKFYHHRLLEWPNCEYERPDFEDPPPGREYSELAIPTAVMEKLVMVDWFLYESPRANSQTTPPFFEQLSHPYAPAKRCDCCAVPSLQKILVCVYMYPIVEGDRRKLGFVQTNQDSIGVKPTRVKWKKFVRQETVNISTVIEECLQGQKCDLEGTSV
jgi:hypothetical protein